MRKIGTNRIFNSQNLCETIWYKSLLNDFNKIKNQ